ncbi:MULTISPECIES: HPr family phosphocarrier protein [Fictibacillus]|jgi:phosphocarrier protein HPr|uniref:HPr family phosphocarrier protein n=2 Tax=Fictibacillaceae TaxID=3120697 RepID=UPI0018CDC106|nr:MULTISPECIES: HPr family phosphocarrier protein [unclassified Fictibacillus]MBH0155007.1 HPr family phosphocarrier protein [Fictibacillus sp. 5RED26]MBH0162445.1 HPr family phosphocarrier protein [Fictibacillus sp. 26RED30]MBH0172197.1 HPr family phosphocarrier protein [Fictibacillus sp. 23RED33]
MKTYFMVQEKIRPTWIHEMVIKANEFEQCQIFFECNTLRINAKSHLSMSLLNGMQGVCCVSATGEDSRGAVDALRSLGTGSLS